MKRALIFLTLVIAFLAFFSSTAYGQDEKATAVPAPLDAYSVIQAINEARTNNGLPTLAADPILMSTAQSTANTMAAAQMRAHIGDPIGRIVAAGYGAGGVVVATENFAMVRPGEESQLMSLWADDAHQVPMVNTNFKQIGAGAAFSPNGFYYYVVHAAYVSGGRPREASPAPGSAAPTSTPVSPAEYIYKVITVTPQIDGKLVHTVRQGQTLWAIAMAYSTHIVDILRINNLPPDFKTTYQGQKLVIPTSSEIPPTATASVTPTQVPETPTRAVTQTPAGSATPTPTPTPTPLIPASIVPNVIIGLIFSVFGILAMYGAFSGRRR